VHDGVLDPTYPPGWATYAGMLADHVADGARSDLGPAGFAERFPPAQERFAARLTRVGMA
jgi:hypothetical protein